MNDLQPSLSGLRVAAFESRRANEIARLIRRFGGEAHVSPSVHEVPVAEDSAVADFAHRLITGEVAVVILLTGVGFDHLLSMAQRHVARQRFLDALADTITIARGPKPTFAMREVGVFPTHAVDKPNTWREILTTIDQHVTVDNQVVAVQEYGQPNTSLMAGLEARGARVMSVSVYRWELPKDRGPLEKNVRRLADGQLDVVLFTSAIQVSHLLKVARQLDLEQPLRQSLGARWWLPSARRQARCCAARRCRSILNRRSHAWDILYGRWPCMPMRCAIASCSWSTGFWQWSHHPWMSRRPGMTVCLCVPVAVNRPP